MKRIYLALLFLPAWALGQTSGVGSLQMTGGGSGTGNMATNVYDVDLNGVIDSVDIGTIGSAHLLDDAVTFGKIALDAVSATEIRDDAVGSNEIIDNSITEQDLNITTAPTDGFLLTSNTGTFGFRYTDPATLPNLGSTNITLDGLTRSINGANGGILQLQQEGTTLLQVGANNDNAVRIRAIEGFVGQLTVPFVSPPKMPLVDVLAWNPEDYQWSFGYNGGEMYYSNGSEWISLSPSAGIGLTAEQSTRISEMNRFSFINKSLGYVPGATNMESNAPGGYGRKVLNYVNASQVIVDTLDGSHNAGDKFDYVVKTSTASISVVPASSAISLIFDDDTATASDNSASLSSPGLFSVLKTDVPNEYLVLGKYTPFETSFAIYQGATAANPVNEVNSVAGITGTGVTWSSVSASPSPQNGTYSVLFERTAANGTDATGFIPLVGVNNGDSVSVTFWQNEVQGVAFSASLSIPYGWTVTNSTDMTSGGWVQKSLTGVATMDDPLLRFYFFNAGNPGDKLGVDNIVVTVN